MTGRVSCFLGCYSAGVASVPVLSGVLLAAALSVHELAAFGGDGPVGLHEHDLSLVGQRIL